MPVKLSVTHILSINVSSGLIRILSTELKSPSFLLRGIHAGKRVNGFEGRKVLFYFHSISAV